MALALPACSGKEGKREYSLPRSLCSVDIKAALLDPFMPDGEKITYRLEKPSGGTERCEILVDGKTALRASQVWWGEQGDVTDVASVHAHVESPPVEMDDKYLSSGTGAVGEVDACGDPAHPQQDFFTVIQVFAPDHSDAPAMKKLIGDYTSALENSKRCSGR
ncbi:hypothetical protein [Streptomyces sp. A1499]|uniref:hypothetical protein n=1 Tax=Streptomyces sp. A1499 TaxID=2563104 RepID=UPI00109E79C0|nr:hypothetical protein [Streptomyces sp. A1499]THC41809.1 hypothetical protein E7X58_36520 [Streptomyces sp. A1499]